MNEKEPILLLPERASPPPDKKPRVAVIGPSPELLKRLQEKVGSRAEIVVLNGAAVLFTPAPTKVVKVLQRGKIVPMALNRHDRRKYLKIIHKGGAKP